MTLRIILLLCLLVLTARAIGATEVFHTAAQQASSPKYVTLPDGHVGGICVDLFRLMEAREPALRIEGDQRFLPLRRLEKKVQHGQLDFICGVREPGQAGSFHRPDPRHLHGALPPGGAP